MVKSAGSNQCIVVRFLTKAKQYDSITTLVPNSQLGLEPGSQFEHAILVRYIENMYWGAKRRKADMRTLEWFVLGVGDGRTILKTGHVVDQDPIPGMVVDLNTFSPTLHAQPENRAPVESSGERVEATYELVIAPTLPYDSEVPKVEEAPKVIPRWTPPWQS